MDVMQETGPAPLDALDKSALDKPQNRTLQRRQELIDAAERVVMREGPDASMNAIAAEAGVTKPILYRHFSDKGGLYNAIAERHIHDLVVSLQDAMSAPGGRRRNVECCIDAYLFLIESRPQVYRFLMHRSGEHPELAGQVALFQRRVGDEVAHGIASDLGLSEQELPLARAWAHGIVGMVLQAGDWWLDERQLSREDLVQQLADLLWGKFAFAPRASAADSSGGAE
jgi:AcrR family transcriptional regulator